MILRIKKKPQDIYWLEAPKLGFKPKKKFRRKSDWVILIYRISFNIGCSKFLGWGCGSGLTIAAATTPCSTVEPATTAITWRNPSDHRIRTTGPISIAYAGFEQEWTAAKLEYARGSGTVSTVFIADTRKGRFNQLLSDHLVLHNCRSLVAPTLNGDYDGLTCLGRFVRGNVHGLKGLE